MLVLMNSSVSSTTWSRSSSRISLSSQPRPFRVILAAGCWYRLVEERREGGPVRRKVLLELGDLPTVDEALGAWARLAAYHRRRATDFREGAGFIGVGRAESVSRSGRL